MDAELNEIQPTKAYKSMDFLNSREARMVRIICEFQETLSRLRKQGVKETIMVFGSARARTTTQLNKAIKDAKEKVASASGADKDKAEAALERLEKSRWMCKICENTTELTRKLTEWAMSYESGTSVAGGFLANDEIKSKKRKIETNGAGTKHEQTLFICTGGGPGLMEAANKGASQVPGAKNIGMGISLPFECGLNPYVSEELAFEYHYFFTRKYWMLFPCRALVCTPGGFGTMDELFELLTLKQTGKIKIDIPVVLFGEAYWKSVVNFEKLVEFGTISQRDYDSLFFTDDVDKAFEHIKEKVLSLRDHPNDHV